MKTSNEIKRHKEQNLRENPNILEKNYINGGTINVQYSTYELKQALVSVKHTSPGQDEICYEILKHLSDSSLGLILGLFNRVWEEGKLPSSWKHGVIVTIAKPVK